jgi:hypothetical protein
MLHARAVCQQDHYTSHTWAPSLCASLSKTSVCQSSPVRCISISRSVAGAAGTASNAAAASLRLSWSDCRFFRLRKLCRPLASPARVGASPVPIGIGTLAIEVKASRSSDGWGKATAEKQRKYTRCLVYKAFFCVLNVVVLTYGVKERRAGVCQPGSHHALQQGASGGRGPNKVCTPSQTHNWAGCSLQLRRAVGKRDM